jgi:hypothetical protein
MPAVRVEIGTIDEFDGNAWEVVCRLCESLMTVTECIKPFEN